MKLTFSAASPFARKVRIAAIELGLIDKIEFTPATVAPGQANEDYSRITPLKKLPVLITNDGDVILDSYVIVEYLNEMAGGSLIPDYGPRRWKAKTNHSLINGMLDSMLLCRYERMVRPQGLQWQAWSDDHWNRAWTGMARFENMPEVLNGPFDISQIGPRLRARLCRFPLRRLRLAQGLSEARRLPPEDAGAAFREDLGAASGVTR
ncbi:glutathione S-transferase family protein [Bradyrhizobium diazoefficiens]